MVQLMRSRCNTRGPVLHYVQGLTNVPIGSVLGLLGHCTIPIDNSRILLTLTYLPYIQLPFHMGYKPTYKCCWRLSLSAIPYCTQ